MPPGGVFLKGKGQGEFTLEGGVIDWLIDWSRLLEVDQTRGFVGVLLMSY